MEFFWGGLMVVNLDRQMDIPWEMSNWPWVGDMEGDLVKGFEWV